MKRTVLALAAVAALIFGVLTAQGGDDKEQKKFEGTWKVGKMQMLGKDAPAELLNKVHFVFKGDKVTIKSSDPKDKDKDQVAVYKVDPSKKPAAIDITPTSGPEKDKTSAGIYKFDGKQLTLCVVASPGDARPTEFASTDASKTILVVLEPMK
jgi:uncharacterized protein (TIGR03067 family)